MTCGKEGCTAKTRWASRHECWQHGLCPKHYWDKTRYLRKRFRLKSKKCPCGCGKNE